MEVTRRENVVLFSLRPASHKFNKVPELKDKNEYLHEIRKSFSKKKTPRTRMPPIPVHNFSNASGKCSSGCPKLGYCTVIKVYI